MKVVVSKKEKTTKEVENAKKKLKRKPKLR